MAVRYDHISSNLFLQNRSALRKSMGASSVAIFNSNDLMPRNGDCFFPFRQDSDFFYLTGIDQEESVLVMTSDHENSVYVEVLFIKENNEHMRIWEGHKYSMEEAMALSGIKEVMWLSGLEEYLATLLIKNKKVYFNQNENERASSPVLSRNDRHVLALKDTYPKHDFVSLASAISDLREVKSGEELALIKKACSITKGAFDRVLSFVKPGVGEHEIEAEITHEFIINRANTHAYSPIVASGKNACVLHYIDNNQRCLTGDLVLLDFGAEYANYASDLTRTIPVSGVFSPRQRKVYESVLKVFKHAKNEMVEGNTLKGIQDSVVICMEKELVYLGLIKAKDLLDQNPEEPLYKKYFMHGTAHFMGLDVHDVGDRKRPLRNGMVLTCEPGIYIEEEEMGVRIENDVLINGDFPIDLMEGVPIEVEEIERLMA